MTGLPAGARHAAATLRTTLPLALLLCLLGGCSDVTTPRAVSGELDLAGPELRDGPAVRLEGAWRFAPNVLVAPDDSDAAFREFAELPSTWDSAVQLDGRPAGHGVGSYRLRVHLPEAARDLGLRVITVGTAYRLYADGALIAGAGAVDGTRAGGEPEYAPVIVPLAPQADDEIVLHLVASNHHNANGGPWEPLWIGGYQQLQREREGRVALATFLAGTFGIIGLYHLVLWLVRRQELSALAFGALCFAIAIRGTAVDEIYIVELFPSLSWAVVVRIEYASMLVAVGCAWAFVRDLFPQEIPPVLPRLFGGACAAFVLCVLLLPVWVFTGLLPGMQALIVISAVLAPALVVRALLAGREGAGLFLLGLAAIAATAVHDVLLTVYRSLPTAELFAGNLYLLPSGQLVFMLSQTMLLALRASSAFTELETAKVDLEETRDAVESYARELEKRVAERTAALQDLALELERHARIDGLTGIGNRRFFDEQLQSAWGDHLRRDSELALILVDVDQFKRFNDARGHVEGDAALRAVAEVLDRTASRPRDVVGRYGGEELAVVLPDTNEDGACHLAEEMRAAVEDLAIVHPNSDLGVVTISVGVAALRPTATHEPEGLVQLADAALYRAKDAGRNRVATDRVVTVAP
jgi:diguanylate cyclase (GGDEF)-like protein